MKIAVIAITDQGLLTGLEIGKKLTEFGHEVCLYANPRGQNLREYQIWSGPIAELFPKLFKEFDALCCVMALGIVVRLIGPLCVHKSLDPAVLVVDEAGQFVISALSGHLGGANALARELASSMEATPVITTASDVQGKVAVDELARQLGWTLEPLENIVHVNSALVNGMNLPVLNLAQIENVNVFDAGYTMVHGTDWNVARFPKGVVVITNRQLKVPQGAYIALHPKNVCIGIGCRRGTPAELIHTTLDKALESHNISRHSLKCIGTIDAKGQEPGLLQVAQELGLPLYIYTAEEINGFTRDYNDKNSFEPLSWSDFVYQKMGVGGVCEPVALMSGKNTKLIQGKVSNQGVTVALAEEL